METNAIETLRDEVYDAFVELLGLLEQAPEVAENGGNVYSLPDALKTVTVSREGLEAVLTRLARMSLSPAVADVGLAEEDGGEEMLRIWRAWAERDPAVAQAMELIDRHQVKDLDELDRYYFTFEEYAYLRDTEANPELLAAIEMLWACLQRGVPQDLEVQS
jgi:hypothetical protein